MSVTRHHQDPAIDRLLANLDASQAALADNPLAITTERLRAITGFDDLEFVTEAEFIVDEDTGTVDQLGTSLPGVTDLRLSNSHVTTFRSFGTRLTRLKRLWLNRSSVKDLSGVHFMHQLSEVYLAFNGIKHLAPLAALLNLEIVDLEGNCVSSIEEVEDGLGGLSELKCVSLTGNPFAIKLIAEGGYRKSVVAALSGATSLTTLDDLPVSDLQDPVAADNRAELALLHDALRVNAPSLQQVVEEQHRGLFSRQSSSAAGVRRAATTGQSRTTPPVGSVRGTHQVFSSSELEVPEEPRATLNSAPAHLGSPSKQDASTKVSRASATLPSPPPARPAAQPVLASSSLVYSGSITRTLRQSRVSSRGGAELRQLDSSATPPTARTSTSASFDTPLDEDDIFDDTPEAHDRRRADAELDKFINDALSKLHSDVPVAAEDDDGSGPHEGSSSGANAAFEDNEDESRPELLAWKARLAQYKVAASNAPAQPLSHADVLHAVISHREGQVKAYQEDLMRDATGGGGGDGYEPIGLDEDAAGDDGDDVL